MAIKKVIICGLGALGLACAVKLKDKCDLKILVDKSRLDKFEKNPPNYNNESIALDYILPEGKFDADLIIITTKIFGLDFAINSIKNYVGKNTTIISLINGIRSEGEISKVYGSEKVLYSYYIGHSIMRDCYGNVQYDGIGKIVFGNTDNSGKVSDLASFFDSCGIDYEVSENITYSLWVKLGVNICLNQLSAIYRQTVGELRQNPEYKTISKKLIKELKEVAKNIGIDTQNMEKDILNSINQVADNGKTSMFQDILCNRKTEVELFSGEIIRLGKQYGIKTPYNKTIYDLLAR